MRKINALFTAAVVAAGLGVTGPPVPPRSTTQAKTATSSSTSAASSITWGTCSEADLAKAGAQCGYLSVPLSYANPSDSKIQIAVSRIEHTSSAKNYRG